MTVEYFNIIIDGFDDYDEWHDYEVKYNTPEERTASLNEMYDDIIFGLRTDFHGGHADIFDEDGNLFDSVEV